MIDILSPILNHPLLQNPYMQSLAILLSFYAFSKIVHIILVRYILRLTKKTKTDIDDKIVESTNRPISLILLTIGGYLAFVPFRESFPNISIVEDIFASITIAIITYIVMRVADVLIDAWGRSFAEKAQSALDNELILLFHRFSRVAIVLVGIMFVLPVWGIQIGPLLASLGIAGVAVAFALQNTLGNIFGGVSLIVDKSVKVGDIIELEGDVFGRITDIGLRSTRLITNDGTMVIIPNGKLADTRVLNHSQPDTRERNIVLFGVAYGSDPSHVREVVCKAVSGVKGVLAGPAPEAMMVSMGDSSVNFRVEFWMDDPWSRLSMKFAVTEAIYAALRKEGIEIPFPTRTIYTKDEKKEGRKPQK
ncbi:TPA: mechanosensitive ion channel family protein [Candidatus Woesearchaeota archaeon]|nr:mechanosensitive ion channel family protein [Candidatus Woesearchaeota archaeon]HII64102.1 mechanosensitive ion channel family protein [Candidatus Woesearchaeota archaeon]